MTVDTERAPHSARSTGFREAVGRLADAQKPGGGVPAYMRWVNRRIARTPAALAYVLGMTPNQVTALSALVSGLGLVVLVAAPVSIGTGAATAVLLAAGFALDSADGQLARLRGGGSHAGEWLDHVVDAVRTPTIHLAALVALWRGGEVPDAFLAVPLVAAVAAAGGFMAQILAEQLSGRRTAPSGDGQVLASFARLPIDMGVLCWIFVAWGFPTVFAWAYGLLVAVNVAHTVFSMTRKYRMLGA